MNYFFKQISTRTNSFLVEVYKDGVPVIYDKEIKTSLFHNPDLISALLSGQINGQKVIKPVTLRLYLYIIYTLKTDQDKIDLYFPDIKDRLVIGKTAFSEAINQLIALRIIAKSQGKKRSITYDINPEILFNGNRGNYMKGVAPQKITRSRKKKSI
jgi:hypothetical protein